MQVIVDKMEKVLMAEHEIQGARLDSGLTLPTL